MADKYTDLRKYSVKVLATNSTEWREVIRVHTMKVAEQCVEEYKKDIPNALFKIVERW